MWCCVGYLAVVLRVRGVRWQGGLFVGGKFALNLCVWPLFLLDLIQEVYSMETEDINGVDYRNDAALNRGKAIRAHCLTCVCGNAAEVRRCHVYDCHLWPWRMGPGAVCTAESGDRDRDASRAAAAKVHGFQSQE